MSEALGDAVLDLRTDSAAFDRGIDRAERQARRLQQSLDRVGRAAQRIGSALSIGVTAPVLAAGAASIRTASNFQELRNLARETFEGATSDVLEWSKRTAQAMQRSRQEVLQFTTDFAAFLKPLGVAPDAVVPMSKALSQLTTDLSSFRNISEEVVFQRLFSGLAGETEAVRRLGIDIGQAALNAELMRMGFEGSVQEASQAQKVMARFSLIMKQTTDAQGDAIRTAGAFENQTRALGAAIADLRLLVGNQLLPAATDFIRFATGVAQNLANMEQGTARQVVVFGAFAAAIGPALVGLGLFTRVIGFAIGGLRPLLTALSVVGRGFVAFAAGVQRAIVVAASSIFTFPGLIAGAIASAIAAVLLFPETLKKIFSIEALKALLDTVRVSFQNFVVKPVVDAVNFVIEQFNKLSFLGLELPTIPDQEEAKVKQDTRDFMSDLGDTFNQEAVKAKSKIESGIKTVSDSARGLIDRIGGPIKDLFSFPEASEIQDIQQSQNTVATGMEKLKKSGQEASNEIGKAFKRAGDGISQSLADAVTRGRDLLGSLANVVDQVLNTVIRAGIQAGLGSLLGGTTIGGFLGFAEGGRPPVGRPSVVGERGPEVFVPDRSGTILPNEALGGNNTAVTLNIDARGADEGSEERIRQIGRDELIPQAVHAARGAVQRDLRRPGFA